MTYAENADWKYMGADSLPAVQNLRGYCADISAQKKDLKRV